MDTIKFGLTIPYGSPRAGANLVREAEQAGWDGAFLGDAIWCQDPMICLAAAAMVTERIRLGTLVTPVPLRIPWKLASESLALDHLSNGRVTLGLGAGAVWMGWQAFPDEVTDKKARAEMLDETIDILTLLYQRKQFDYDGRHYHVKLTQMDLQHFPPRPVQQPRIPLWVVGVWPRMKSMQRVLKADGLLMNKINAQGQFENVLPADLREVKAYIEANRTLTTPFDYVAEGATKGMSLQQAQDAVGPWAEAGATWFIDGLWNMDEAEVLAHIRRGPPKAL